MKNNCLLCGEPFVGKRSDAKYCSNSCKSKYFELRSKGQIKTTEGVNGLPTNGQSVDCRQSDDPTRQPSQTTEGKTKLRTVDMEDLIPFENVFMEDEKASKETDLNFGTEKTDAKQNATNSFSSATNQNSKPVPEQYILKTIKIDNPNYLECSFRLKKCRNEIERLEGYMAKLEILRKQNYQKYLQGLEKDFRQYVNLKKEYDYYDNRIDEITEMGKNKLVIVRSWEKSILSELSIYPAQHEKTEKVINPAYTLWSQQKTANNGLAQNTGQNLGQPHSEKLTVKFKSPFGSFGQKKEKSDITVGKIFPKKTQTVPKETTLETSKISSMKKVADMKFQLLNFKGKWNTFFGLPQTNFYCVIHGMSGEGKTNFSIQFAKYLAENFGNVLYISGEEGFAPTFQQKVKDLGADNVPRLYAIDIRSGREILTEIPNKFHFIVIDSLNNMEIDIDTMKAIRLKFKQSGIIAICQSTKDGKIRGSYQIVHDSDIAVKVMNGIACTTKNRFKEKGMEFNVFEIYQKNKTKPDNPKDQKRSDDIDGIDLDFNNTI